MFELEKEENELENNEIYEDGFNDGWESCIDSLDESQEDEE